MSSAAYTQFVKRSSKSYYRYGRGSSTGREGSKHKAHFVILITLMSNQLICNMLIATTTTSNE